MKNYIIGLVVLIVVLVGGFYALNAYIYNEKQVDEGVSLDPKDGRYIISGEFVQLVDGVSETAIAQGSASTMKTQYFGNEARGDLDGDGDEDVVFLITQEGGGSGTFFYLVGAIKEEKGYRGTNAVLIGDRIAPQTTEYRDLSGQVGGQIIVNYAERAPGEPMTVQPSMGKSLYLKYDPESMSFGELVQNFEGEADPSVMKLDMKTWVWDSALYNDGTEVKPNKVGDFSITFDKDGRFTASTDCNQMAGQYVADGNLLTMSQIVSTKMYCEGSKEGDFAKILENTASFLFTSRGQLIFEIKFDSGTATFR